MDIEQSNPAGTPSIAMVDTVGHVHVWQRLVGVQLRFCWRFPVLYTIAFPLPRPDQPHGDSGRTARESETQPTGLD